MAISRASLTSRQLATTRIVAAAESAQLAHDFSNPVGAARRIAQGFEEQGIGVLLLELLAHVFEVPDHIGQGIVDLVTDAGAEPTERGEALELTRLSRVSVSSRVRSST